MLAPTLYSLLVFLHVLGVVVWVGGMFFAHVCLRPAAQAVLQPPQRIPLMLATLQRFFVAVAVSATVVVATGLIMMSSVGYAHAPTGWHVMMTLGLVMAAVFVVILALPFRKLRTAAASGRWPDAAGALGMIRRLVAFNLVLGILALAAVVFSR